MTPLEVAAGDLPPGWTLAQIGSLIPPNGIFCDGDWVESKDQNPDGDVRLIQLADVGDGTFMNRSSRFLTSEKAAELRCTYLKTGDILVARMPAPLGRACIFPLDGDDQHVTVVDVCIIRTDHDQVDRTYLCHVINFFGVRRQIDDLQTGTTRKRISRKNLSTVPIPLPPINEQRRIAARIDELFSKLDNGAQILRTARAELDLYRQAAFKHALEGRLTKEWREEHEANIETSEQLLARIQIERETQYLQQIRNWKASVQAWEKGGKQGRKSSKPSRIKKAERISPAELTDLPSLPRSWQYVRLSEIANVGSGMSVSKARKLADPIEIPYLSVANVQRGALDLSRVKTMNIERSQLPDLELNRWDVLFNEGGDRDKLGRGWIWESQIEPCITQNHVFRASPVLVSEEHSKWISHWGNSFGQRYFETQGKQTTNLASINKAALSRCPIPLPPFEEQVEILRRIDIKTSIIDHIEQSIVTALERVDALRQSILSRGSNGQLVAQDPSDEPASILLDRIRAAQDHIMKRAIPRMTGQRKTAKATA